MRSGVLALRHPPLVLAYFAGGPSPGGTWVLARGAKLSPSRIILEEIFCFKIVNNFIDVLNLSSFVFGRMRSTFAALQVW